MAETKKAKKLRIYKLASDINISTEAIVEFLKEKGYEIKNHMTILSEEMLSDVHDHFKKDIDKSDEHKRKLARFNKMRAEKAEADHPTTDEDVETEQEVPESDISEEAETGTEEVAEVQAEETEEGTEKDSVEELDGEEESDSFRTDAEKAIQDKKTGLTVLGKIDLAAEKKRTGKKKESDKKEKEGESSDGKQTDDDSTDTKGKRKRLKVKKRTSGNEETVRAKKFKKVKKAEVDKREVEAAIKRTMLSMDDSSVSDRASHRKKRRKEKLEEQEKIIEEQIELEQTLIRVTEFIAVNEMANLMNVSVSDVIAKCIGMGLMVSINQRLDSETITLVADEFGFEVEFEEEYQAELLVDTEDEESTLIDRPPVVTIMGHVDHGKTSLLDFIRTENVVADESGGITQHIGAYQVKVDGGKKITFLDTPGHEAFTAMRARGAKVTDIVVLIVAADDAVMPQTIEAINHAQAAEVPIIIAINKIDKPGSNVEKIKQQLAERNILVEDWGGKFQSVEVSAKTGLNVELLLEKILLEAELLELKANPDRMARGNVVEAQMEPGRGITATTLISKGTLKVGDPFVAGNHQGRVRAMFDEAGKKLNKVTPGSPALVLGFEGIPQAGDMFVVVKSEREAREVSLKRQQLKREQDHRQVKLITLDEIAHQISAGQVKDLPIIVKGDVDGSVEALADSMMKLSNEEVKVNVIHKGVGGITEGDVLLAAASGAIIIGFHVRANSNARKLAENEKIEIRLYNVIYDAINQVKSALEGLLSPVISEEFVATVEVRDTFKVPKIGTVAGCYVQDGKITRTDKIRLFRDGIVIYEGNLATLKRFKDDVKEVVAGYECGLNIANFNDIKVNDIIEAYQIVETKKKLEN